MAVSLALEAKASQRELTSRLLAELCGPVLACRDLESAFDKLLWELPDLVLDTPAAPQVNPPESSALPLGWNYISNDAECLREAGPIDVKSFLRSCLRPPHTHIGLILLAQAVGQMR